MTRIWLKRVRKLFLIIQNLAYIKALLKYSVAAAVEHTDVLRNLSQLNCSTIVDIGANRGQFALIARRWFPLAHIISFEPLREPASLFRRVFSSDPNVLLYEYAIGSISQEMKIHVAAADDSSSLLPISSLQIKLFPSTAEKETRTVQVKPLDKVLNPVDVKLHALLKIDVQGFELNVLEGCKNLLHYFTYIYVECSFVELYKRQGLAHEVIAWLHKLNFRLAGIYNTYYDENGLAIQGDFLFENSA